MRDIAYEQALIRHQQRMLRILDEYHNEEATEWTERDFLAIQRALQIMRGHEERCPPYMTVFFFLKS